MMLENLYPIKLIQKNAIYALVLGIAYTTIGIGFSVWLFGEDPALVAVAFAALLFYPTLKQLLAEEEDEEVKAQNFRLWGFLKEHQNIFKVYMLFFIGSMLVFAFFTLMLPALASNHLFNNQVGYLIGKATFSSSLFSAIFANNLMVLIVIFLTALLLGDGGIFLITWNASVWGTVFGLIAKQYASITSQNPFYIFLAILAVVITHTLLEAFAYISAATAGGVISGGLVKEKFLSEKFNRVVKGTIITLIFALLILLIAVSVETWVLGNASFYQQVRAAI